MSTILQDLAQWATSLDLAQVRSGTRDRVLLQHLNLAAATRQAANQPVAKGLRAGAGGGSARLVGGGRASRRDAVRVHAGLSGWLNQADHLFWSCTGPGSIPAAWSMSKGKSIGDLLRATVAANEIGGRLGASLLIGPQRGDGAAVTTSLCSSVVAGLLEGLDAETLAHAMALSIAVPGRASDHIRYAGGQARALLHASPAVHGLDAVAMAKAGMTGPLGLLDRQDGVLEALCWVPLRNAFSGLGRAWLSDTLSYKLTPVALPAQVAVQSVAEILARHLKAAGRRLRPDQVDRVEIRTSLPCVFLEEGTAGLSVLDASTVSASTCRAVATLLVGHELGPEQLSDVWLDQEKDRILDLASRVELKHSWECSMQQITHLVESVAPLFAGLTAKEIKGVLACAGGEGQTTWPRGLSNQWQVLKARPDRLMDRIRYASGDLADVDWSDWQLRFPTEVRLYTTRGGSWPENRAIPEGSPGWPWQKTVDRVVDRFAAENEELSSRARQLLLPDLQGPADDWVDELLH